MIYVFVQWGYKEVVSMRTITIVLLACAVLTGGWAVAQAGPAEVTLTYLGHSCFTFHTENGPMVMIDPYGEYVPYPALPQPADLLMITHDHVDHSAYDRVEGDPLIIWGLNDAGRSVEGQGTFKGVWLKAVSASHGTYKGKSLGEVTMFVFEVGGIRFAHLADLGTLLSPEQIAELGKVEVLFVPVGGVYTIDADQAVEVAKSLPSVRIVIPMHYFVEGLCPWPLAPVDDFLAAAGEHWTVRRLDASEVKLSKESLPDKTEVWVMRYQE